MAEEPENLTLTILREMRNEMRAGFAVQHEDTLDVKVRLSSVETHVAEQAVQLAALNRRIDRFDERVSRIERRLDLVDA